MIDLRNYAVIGLAGLAVVLGGLLLHQRAQTAQARTELADYKLASERAAELQRETNRGAAREAEVQYVERTVYRDKFITKIETEIRHVAAPLASCPLPDGLVRMLNDAAACAAEDRPATCGAGDGMRPPG